MNEPKYILFKQPEYTHQVTIAGEYGLVMQIEKPPCAFHRLMQSLILGFKWEKLPTNEKL